MDAVPWWLKWMANVAEIAAGDWIGSDMMGAIGLGALIMVAGMFYLVRRLRGVGGQKMGPPDVVILGLIGLAVFSVVTLGGYLWKITQDAKIVAPGASPQTSSSSGVQAAADPPARTIPTAPLIERLDVGNSNKPDMPVIGQHAVSTAASLSR
jgi:hypothetical protein